MERGTRVPLGDLEPGEAPVPCGLGKLPRKRLLAGRGFTGEFRGERAGDAARDSPAPWGLRHRHSTTEHSGACLDPFIH